MREVHLSELVRILEPRAYELLSLVHDEIVTLNLQSLITSGLVLTGGGSLLSGMKEVAQEIFNCDVRIGSPRLQFGLFESLDNPMYATSYGLLLHALKEKNGSLHDMSGTIVNKVFVRMKSWISDFF